MCSHFTLSQPSHPTSRIQCQAQGYTVSHTSFHELLASLRAIPLVIHSAPLYDMRGAQTWFHSSVSDTCATNSGPHLFLQCHLSVFTYLSLMESHTWYQSASHVDIHSITMSHTPWHIHCLSQSLTSDATHSVSLGITPSDSPTLHAVSHD